MIAIGSTTASGYVLGAIFASNVNAACPISQVATLAIRKNGCDFRYDREGDFFRRLATEI
jgi:hypothetical protein